MTPGDTGIDYGTCLRELREKAGLSLRDIEERSGGAIKSSHLSMVETGRVRAPSLAFLRNLADALHIRFTSLLVVLGVAEQEEGSLDPDALVVLSYFDDIPEEARTEAMAYLRWRAEQGRQGAGRGTQQ